MGNHPTQHHQKRNCLTQNCITYVIAYLLNPLTIKLLKYKIAYLQNCLPTMLPNPTTNPPQTHAQVELLYHLPTNLRDYFIAV